MRKGKLSLNKHKKTRRRKANRLFLCRVHVCSVQKVISPQNWLFLDDSETKEMKLVCVNRVSDCPVQNIDPASVVSRYRVLGNTWRTFTWRKIVTQFRRHKILRNHVPLAWHWFPYELNSYRVCRLGVFWVCGTSSGFLTLLAGTPRVALLCRVDVFWICGTSSDCSWHFWVELPDWHHCVEWMCSESVELLVTVPWCCLQVKHQKVPFHYRVSYNATETICTGAYRFSLKCFLACYIQRIAKRCQN